jgi:hypothetical protein
MKELAKAKGFSLICETPACPIIGALGLYLDRVTGGAAASRPEGYWDIEVMSHSNLDACKRRAEKGPSFAQRQFVSQMWGVSVDDQLEIEHYLNNKTDLSPLDNPTLVRLCIEALPHWNVVWHTLLWHRPEQSAW